MTLKWHYWPKKKVFQMRLLKVFIYFLFFLGGVYTKCLWIKKKKWQLWYYLNVQLSSSNIFIQSKVPFESICPYCEAYFTLNNVSILSRIHGSSHNVWKYVSSNAQIWKNHRIGITHSKPLDVKMIKGRPRQEAWLGTSSMHCFFKLCVRHCA